MKRSTLNLVESWILRKIECDLRGGGIHCIEGQGLGKIDEEVKTICRVLGQ